MAKNTKTKPIKAIVALCEGKTDVAFLRRLLEVDDYKDYKEIVANMPTPLGFRDGSGKYSYFSNELKSYKYDSSQLRDRPILPLILRRTRGNSDTFLLLYDMSGMDNISSYKKIIKDFQNLSSKSPANDGYEKSVSKMDVALAFIYDLDDKLRTDRIEFIKNSFGDSISELQYLTEAKSIIDSKHFFGVGYHFICNEDGDKGNLEDLIVPMMKDGKEDLFENAGKFLNSEKEFIRYKKTNPTEKDDNKTESDFKKSLIGAIGQIKASGVDNANIIKLTKYLDKDKFRRSVQCAAILKFIRDLRNSIR